jgi:hypothetical protein
VRWLWWFVYVAIAAACARQPDADAIRAAITEMARATEAQRSADVLVRVSDDFTGNDGEVDRTQLANVLLVQLLAHRSIGVRLGTIDIELSGDRATARFDATLTDASGRWLVDRRAVLRFVTGWRRERGAWRCYNATWSSNAR